MKHALAKLWTVVAALLLSACGGGDEPAGGTPTYAKSYGGTRFDAAHAIAGTADGGTVVAGVTAANRDGSWADLWVAKLDPNGNVLWDLAVGAQPVGTPERKRTMKIVRSTPDGGFVAVGVATDRPESMGPPSATGDDAWIAKFSAAGVIEWQADLDSGAWSPHEYARTTPRAEAADDHAVDVWPLPDGGFLIAAASQADVIDRDTSQLHVAAVSVVVWRLDAAGATRWQRRLTDGEFTNPNGVGTAVVRATAEGGAVLAFSPLLGDGYVLRMVRLSAVGERLWQHDEGNWSVETLVQTDDPTAAGAADGARDDGFVIVANHPGADALVVKLDAAGSLQWRRVHVEDGGSVSIRGADQVCRPRPAVGVDCEIVLAGQVYPRGATGPGAGQAHLVRLSAAGELVARHDLDAPSALHDIAGAAGGELLIGALQTADRMVGRIVLDARSLAAVDASADIAYDGASGPDPLQIGADGALTIVDPYRQRWVRHVAAAPLPMAATRLDRSVDLARVGGHEVAHAVVEVAPGSVIVAGSTDAFRADGYSLPIAWLLRITDGRVDWQRQFMLDQSPQYRDSVARALVPSGDGGVIVAIDRNGGRNAELLKVSGSGDVVWQSEPLGTVWDPLTVRDLLAVPGGGYAMVADAEFGSARSSVMFRFDADGALLWQRRIEQVLAHSIAATDDGGFVVGAVDVDGAGRLLLLVRLDAGGHVTGSRRYGLPGAMPAVGAVARVRRVAGGHVVATTSLAEIAPEALGQPYGQSNILLLRVDAAGTPLWSRSYGALLDERLHDLQVLADGGLAIAGGSDSFGDGAEAWVLRLGPDGRLVEGCNAHLGSPPASAFGNEALEVRVLVDEVSRDPPFGGVVAGPFTPAVARAAASVVARQCFGTAAPPDAALPPTVRFALTVHQPGTQTGVVTSTPAGLVCGTAASAPPCSAEFGADTDVFLDVDPGSAERFVRWEDCDTLVDDASGPPSCRVRMSRDRAVRAVFGAPRDRFRLHVQVVGTGTVHTGDGGVQCGAFYGAAQDCEQLYEPRIAGTDLPTTISLAVFTHVADFVGWGGDCATFGTAAAFNLVIDGDKHCTATFVGAPTSFTLTLAKAGTGSGLVTSAPAGLSCGAACSASFGAGQTVRLLATEDAGSAFDGWTGCDRVVPPPAGSIPVCEVDMNAARTVSAAFVHAVGGQYLLELTVFGSDGIVESADHGIVCTASGPDCQQLYNPGTSVRLSYNLLRSRGQFLGWGGDCASFGLTATPTLVMNGDKRCTASFSSPS